MNRTERDWTTNSQVDNCDNAAYDGQGADAHAYRCKDVEEWLAEIDGGTISTSMGPSS
jgi:hypothetical protein